MTVPQASSSRRQPLLPSVLAPEADKRTVCKFPELSQELSPLLLRGLGKQKLNKQKKINTPFLDSPPLPILVPHGPPHLAHRRSPARNCGGPCSLRVAGSLSTLRPARLQRVVSSPPLPALPTSPQRRLHASSSGAELGRTKPAPWPLSTLILSLDSNPH